MPPVARGKRYEDPLQAALAARHLGTVDGGGSQFGEGDEIVFAELELYVADLDQALDVTKQTLEQPGAPVGSELQLEADGRCRSKGSRYVVPWAALVTVQPPCAGEGVARSFKRDPLGGAFEEGYDRATSGLDGHSGTRGRMRQLYGAETAL